MGCNGNCKDIETTEATLLGDGRRSTVHYGEIRSTLGYGDRVLVHKHHLLGKSHRYIAAISISIGGRQYPDDTRESNRGSPILGD